MKLPRYIDLDDLRKSIDLLDESLMLLLAERMRLIIKVGIVKKYFNLDPTYSEMRKRDLEKTLMLAEQGQISHTFMEKFYHRIYEEALMIIKNITNYNNLINAEEKLLDSEMLLADLRKSIYNVDVAICHTLVERLRVVAKVGAYKKTHHLKPLAPKRWHQVLANKLTMARTLKTNEQFIKDLFNLIHEEALRIESE